MVPLNSLTLQRAPLAQALFVYLVRWTPVAYGSVWREAQRGSSRADRSRAAPRADAAKGRNIAD
jgi:hypothetical protein